MSRLALRDLQSLHRWLEGPLIPAPDICLKSRTKRFPVYIQLYTVRGLDSYARKMKDRQPCAAHLDVNDWWLASSHSAEGRSCLTASRCGQPLVWTPVKADGCSNHRLNGWVKAWLCGKTSGILAASARSIYIVLVCYTYNTQRAQRAGVHDSSLCLCAWCVWCAWPHHV
jgi:hypothetical protein